MSGAVVSRLDPSVFHLLRARRRCREEHAEEKLALLRRLERQKVIRDLPETRVEQSFNEQLFAEVLGYRTLLSHDGAGFHMLPKNQVGPRRFDDFSLGHFGRDGGEVLATAEFKSPGTDLHHPQAAGSYSGNTPVQQALSAAALLPACRWSIVSNFRTILLYDVHTPREPLAVADLHEVRTRDDLAALCAHVDMPALIGEKPTQMGELVAAAAERSPALPLARDVGHYRLVVRFTPKGPERIFALACLEERLHRTMATVHPAEDVERLRTAGRTPVRIEMRDGWVCSEATNGPRMAVRVAVSRFGQVIVSTRLLVDQSPVNPTKRFELYDLEGTARLFLRACKNIFDLVPLTHGNFAGTKSEAVFEGEIGMDLLDVGECELHIHEGTFVRIGTAPGAEVFAGDFDVGWVFLLGEVVAKCLADLTIQFRKEGRGLSLDTHAVASRLLDGVNEPGS